MTNRTAIITGGSKRLGKAMAIGLADSGYAIALHYHHSKTQAQETADEIIKNGGQCQLFQADLADTTCCESLIDNIAASMPSLAVLINNASIFQESDFTDITQAHYDEIMNVNIKAPFFLSQAFAKHCQSGVIINMLDTYITKHKTPYFAYLMSKKSLKDLTKMAALALAPSIRVNGICPGLVDLPQPLPDHFTERKKELLPAQKLVTVEEVVDAVLTLVTSEHITGQCLYIDSGEHLL